jgi:hypothetical protein
VPCKKSRLDAGAKAALALVLLLPSRLPEAGCRRRDPDKRSGLAIVLADVAVDCVDQFANAAEGAAADALAICGGHCVEVR